MPAGQGKLDAGVEVARRRVEGSIDAVADPPVAEAVRKGLLAAARRSETVPRDVVAIVESDPALTIHVLRAAAERRFSPPGDAASVPAAVDRLTPAGVAFLVGDLDASGAPDPHAPEAQLWAGLRWHLVGARQVIERLAGASSLGLDTARLRAAALLHDVGKLVLEHARHGYADAFHVADDLPETRLEREREELGCDHAEAGARLLRRWGLPEELAEAVERHHDAADATAAAFVRAADMLVRYGHGDPIAVDVLVRVCGAIGIRRDALGALLYEAPNPLTRAAARGGETDCPLTERELQVLRELGQGQASRQIAHDLGIAQGTVRNHVRHICSKLAVPERGQAVAKARERGWI